jgi:hypothetical protein
LVAVFFAAVVFLAAPFLAAGAFFAGAFAAVAVLAVVFFAAVVFLVGVFFAGAFFDADLVAAATWCLLVREPGEMPISFSWMAISSPLPMILATLRRAVNEIRKVAWCVAVASPREFG